jgi:hypothetical protein
MFNVFVKLAKQIVAHKMSDFRQCDIFSVNCSDFCLMFSQIGLDIVYPVLGGIFF